jgi:imidazoleglycerol-phosphate dehydratase
MTILSRQTRETRIRLRLETGGAARSAAAAPGATIATTDAFLDHRLTTLAAYAGVRLDVEAAGDLRHHLVEDVAIALGTALRRETPSACARYGEATVPMDDALVHAALDLGGRFWYEGPLPSPLYDHFLRSFAENAGMTLHIRVLRGRDRHHVVEAAIKAVGLALRGALVEGDAVFSTKGAIEVTFEGGA